MSPLGRGCGTVGPVRVVRLNVARGVRVSMAHTYGSYLSLILMAHTCGSETARPSDPACLLARLPAQALDAEMARSREIEPALRDLTCEINAEIALACEIELSALTPTPTLSTPHQELTCEIEDCEHNLEFSFWQFGRTITPWRICALNHLLIRVCFIRVMTSSAQEAVDARVRTGARTGACART